MRSLGLLVLVAGCSNSSSNLGSFDMTAIVDLAPSPDAAGQFGATCDLFAKTSCHGGLHCATTAIGDVCIPDPGTQEIPEGAECTAISQGSIPVDYCAPGTSCIAYDGVSRCRRVCFTHGDCANGDTCTAPTASGAMKKIMGMMVPLSGCVADEGCDPIGQTGCAQGLSCYFSGADEVGRSRVCDVKSGSGPPDVSCMSHRDCKPGETCSGLGFCRLLCLVQPVTVDGGTFGACPAAEGTCNPFFGSGATYGLCE